MKQRLLLSILSILALVYFALPRLPLDGGITAQLFSWVWLGFCLAAFGGNVSVLLFGRRREVKREEQKKTAKAKERYYGRGTDI